MKISVDEDGEILLEEVFNGVHLRTPDGISIGIVMRDGTLEYHLYGTTVWYRIDPLTGIAERL